METIGGSSHWRLTIRRDADHVTILRAVTCDRRAILPEELFDLPVVELSHHALAAFGPTPVGEEVEITCGPAAEDAQWDNRELTALTLPATLRRIGDYAFLGCTALRELRLWDDIRYWGGSAFMNCRSLDTFCLTRRTAEQGETLAYITGELSRELDVTVKEPSGTLRLVFPEFTELYEENCPAHHFDYTIDGAGYPYHYVFRQKKLNVKDFDALWKDYLRIEHEETTALHLAWQRLRYPVELTAKAKEQYLAYLRSHAGEAAEWLLTERDAPGMGYLLSLNALNREELAAACEQARRMGAAEILALLLEEQHRRFPPAAAKTFDL